MLKASTRAICISPFVARQRHRNYHRYLRMYWLFRGSRKIWHFCHGLLASPDVFACLFRGSFHCSRFSSEIGWLSSVIGGLTTGVAGCSRTKGGKNKDRCDEFISWPGVMVKLLESEARFNWARPPVDRSANSNFQTQLLDQLVNLAYWHSQTAPNAPRENRKRRSSELIDFAWLGERGDYLSY